MVQVIEEDAGAAGALGRGLGGFLANAPVAISKILQERGSDKKFKELTGMDVSGYSPDVKKRMMDMAISQQQNNQIVNALVSRGVDPEEAKLYAMLTTGGQTQFVKDMFESKKRGTLGTRKTDRANRMADVAGQEQEPEIAMEEKELTPEQQLDREIEGVLADQDEGLTPSERVKRESERFKTGYPALQEASSKLESTSRNKERLGILEDLEKSGKLIKGLGRFNLNAEGNLRLPFLASAETQRFVKTLNEFSQNAKDTYGARVTNFDLAQYLRRFPTLMNSEEGRKQIIQQMKVINDINAVYYKNLKDVYRRAGGARRIDADQAMELAEKASSPVVQEMAKKLETIGKITSLPNAVEHKGRKILNEKSGQVLISNGEDWVPAEG